MKKNYKEALKEVKKEILDTSNKLKNNNSKEIRNLLISKFTILEEKYLKILIDLDIANNNAKKELIVTYIRAIILYIAELILMSFDIINLHKIQMFIILGLSQFINLYNMVCFADIAIELNRLKKARDFHKESNMYEEYLETKDMILEMQKTIDQDNIEKITTINEFEVAYTFINNYLYTENYKIPEIKQSTKDNILKILQYDLNSEEKDIIVLLEQAKEKTKKSHFTKILKINKK